jgi:hypothetical protein
MYCFTPNVCDQIKIPPNEGVLMRDYFMTIVPVLGAFLILPAALQISRISFLIALRYQNLVQAQDLDYLSHFLSFVPGFVA